MEDLILTAALIGSISSARKLLAGGADINCQNSEGETPLIIATKYRHVEFVKFMLSKGADASVADNSGKTAADYARESNDTHLVDALRGVKEAPSFSHGDPDEESFVTLAANLYAVYNDIKPFVQDLSMREKTMMKNDFLKLLFFAAKGGQIKPFYKYSYSLLILSIINTDPNEDYFMKANGLASNEMKAVLLKFYESDQDCIERYKNAPESFSLDSLSLFKDDALNKVRTAFYQFAEFVIKADGTVSAQEEENLKQIAAQYFNNSTSSLEAGQEKVTGEKSLDEILADLNELVGLDNIKQDIKSLINIINANKLRRKEGLPEHRSSLHSVFIGPPGTGKTTIARMLSEIYHHLEVLPGNNFVETDRSGLVAGYVGQTAIKTNEIVEKAMNGVLFIDEAYTLKREGSSDNDFGQEAIDIILKRMEDHRDNLVIVVAGYEAEMNTFINSNPGLKSRFNRYFYFDNYNPEQLTAIFKLIVAKSGFILTDEALQKSASLFDRLYQARDKQFGNARLVRNIFEKTFENHANRTAAISPVTRELLTTLEPEDIPENY